jgi:hypothetical protein
MLTSLAADKVISASIVINPEWTRAGCRGLSLWLGRIADSCSVVKWDQVFIQVAIPWCINKASPRLDNPASGMPSAIARSSS